MFSSIVNIFRIKDLRKKVVITLLLLLVCRIGAQVPTPGVNTGGIEAYFKAQQEREGGSATLWTLINMFSGGAFRRATILALGIMPYISASIILQLLTAVIPSLEKLAKEGGEEGRKKITQYTRYGTVVLCAFQAYVMSSHVEGMGAGVVANPGLSFRLVTMVAMTTGTMFLMWVGEMITEYGIGNGISLIITVGIVSRLPLAISEIWSKLTWNPMVVKGTITFAHLAFLVLLFLFVTAGVVMLTQGTRRIPVQYAKRVVGRKIYAGQSSYIPLRVNYAGVIPIIFASSILLFPATLAQMTNIGFLRTLGNYLSPGSALYLVLYVLMIIFFCYFWTATQFDPIRIANDMKKNGAFVPGIRPGKPTSSFLEFTMNRITFSGAIFLATVAILPQMITHSLGVSYNIAQYFGGTGLLIIVGVLLDTLRAVESHLLMRHYDGLTKKGKLRGRR